MTTRVHKPTPTLTRALRSERGMTLVEIIVVIVLISMVFGVVASGILSSGESAKADLNMVKMEKVKSALGQYRLKFNRYPEKLEYLVSGAPDAKERGILATKLVEEKDLEDVWGAPYDYRSLNNGKSFTLSSLGADGTTGGEGANQDVTKKP